MLEDIRSLIVFKGEKDLIKVALLRCERQGSETDGGVGSEAETSS